MELTKGRARAAFAVLGGSLVLAGLVVAIRAGHRGEPAAERAASSGPSHSRNQSHEGPNPSSPHEGPDVHSSKWSPRLQELKGKLLEAADKGDFLAAREAAWAIQEEATGVEKAQAQLLISKTLDEMSNRRKTEKHAPPGQLMSTDDIRKALMQYVAEGDAARRAALMNEVLRSRIPDILLPDTLRVIEQVLTNPSCDTKSLYLLNCFTGRQSFDELMRFTGASYSKEVRIAALRVMNGRELTREDLGKIAAQLKSDPDDDIRAAWISGMNGKYLPEMDGFGLTAVTDPNPKIRCAAVQGLNPSQGEQKAALIVALRDTEAMVREGALSQLARTIVDPEVLTGVLGVARHDSSESVRLQAVRIMIQERLRGNPEVISTLNGIATQDTSETVRSSALLVLERLKAK